MHTVTVGYHNGSTDHEVEAWAIGTPEGFLQLVYTDTVEFIPLDRCLYIIVPRLPQTDES